MMTPYYDHAGQTIYLGDCREVLAGIASDSIDAVVTDPPYELGFMGKHWDATGIAYDVAMWREVLRVMKPGAHLLAFGGSRTYHRMASAIEDAGFEVRDQIMWLQGQGFPKSLDVSKAIDREAGAKRPCTHVGVVRRDGYGDDWDTGSSDTRPRYDRAVSVAAREWDGWGTALKPAHEPICVARKPCSEATVAANVLRWGAGGINVDGGRIGTDTRTNPAFGLDGWRKQEGRDDRQEVSAKTVQGRWPANVCLDEEAAAMLDEQSGELSGGGSPERRFSDKTRNAYGDFTGEDECKFTIGPTSGGASRFFYCAKASRAERNAGLGGMTVRPCGVHDDDGFRKPGERKANHTAPLAAANYHPTVKPIALMRWLVRLVTPPRGIVLDPFAGSGTTLIAAKLEGVRCLGIEREAEYCEIARARVAAVEASLFEASRNEKLSTDPPDRGRTSYADYTDADTASAGEVGNPD